MGFVLDQLGMVRVGVVKWEFNFPVGIAIHHETKQIFVAVSENECIDVFTNSLSFLCTITPLAPEEFKTPMMWGWTMGAFYT